VTSKMSSKKGSGWDDVQVGDTVQMVCNGRTEYVGKVDARTSDGDVIWVHDPVGDRRLFHIHDGYALMLGP
jgi:hypothetical protein